MKLLTFGSLISSILLEVNSESYNISYFDLECKHSKWGLYKFEKRKWDAELDTRKNSTAIVLKNEITDSNTFTHCQKVVRILTAGHVLLSVRTMNIGLSSCELEYVEIKTSTDYETRTSEMKFCEPDNPVQFPHNVVYKTPIIFDITARFHSHRSYDHIIDILLVLFKNEPCNEIFNFSCRNGMCISRYLFCDGYDHCGDNTDEDDIYNCDSSISGIAVIGASSTKSTIISISVFTVAACVALFFILWYNFNKIRSARNEAEAPVSI